MRCLYVSLSLSLMLGGCTLTSRSVEPALPKDPVSGQPTVAYRLDGQPVVANNYANFSTIITAFFGRSNPVEATLLADGTLQLAALDAQRENGTNETPLQQVRHDLLLQVPQFQGVGTYTRFEANLNRQHWASNRRQWEPEPAVAVAAPGTTQRFIVTEWQPATQELRGSFELTVQVPGGGPQQVITDGWFFATLTP